MTLAVSTETTGLVQQFVERTGQLYSLPAAAAQVLRLADEPQIDRQALKTCLEGDPALAVRILRVVNSSLFGPTRQVTDLNQALTLLGIRPLKMLVLGFSLPKDLFAGLEAEALAHYWRQTLVKAIAARELSEHFWRLPGDEPFLAGLVQDIGVLALIQQLGKPYQELLHHVQSHGGSLLEREMDTLGFDHLVLSARLLSHWGLPAALCAAISVPPDERRINEFSSDERKLPRMLHLADLLARLIEQPYGSALRDLLAVGSRYCNLTYESLQPVVAVLQRKVDELAEALSLTLPDDQSYVDLVLSAQQRLADETLAVAPAFMSPEAEDDLASISSRLQSELAVVEERSQRAEGRGQRSEVRSQKAEGSRPLTPDLRPLGVDRAPLTTHSSARHRVAATIAADPHLEDRVHAGILHARQTRTPLTLALFEIDGFSDLLLQLGPVGMTEVARSLQCALADWTSQRDEALLVSDSRLAILWPDCSRNSAVQLARYVLGLVRPWSREQFPVGDDLRLSAGLATLEFAPKNFPARELIDAAQRCLGGAQLAGGDTVKSIEF